MGRKKQRIAFSAVKNFFEAYTMHDALKEWDGIFVAACKRKIWNNGPPSDLLYFIDLINSLFTASRLISKKKCRSFELSRAIEHSNPEPADFVSQNHAATYWNCFPRHLKHDEYHNPFIVLIRLRKKYSKKQFTQNLKTLTFNALSKQDAGEEYTFFELININKSVLKLIEAAHLIHLRNKNGRA